MTSDQIKFIMKHSTAEELNPNTAIKVVSTTSVGKIYPASNISISFDYSKDLMIVTHLPKANSGSAKFDSFVPYEVNNPTAGQIEYWDFTDIHAIVLKGNITGNSFTAGKNP